VSVVVTSRAATRKSQQYAERSLEIVSDEGEANPEWDCFVANAPGGHHIQTSMWARVKATAGWRANRLVLRRSGEIVGGCQLLWQSLGGLVRVAYVSRGPLVALDQPGELKALLDALEETARRKKLTYLKMQPPTDRHDLERVLEGRGFYRSPLDTSPIASVRIDLHRSPEQLLAAMAPRIRRNIRQSEREDLTIRAGGRDDLPKFFEILQQTAERQRFNNYPLDYWTRVWDEFAPGGWARLFFAELKGRVISAILLIGYGDTVIYKIGGWTGERTKARPNESMHWAAMQWARASGYHYYDLEGIPLTVARAILAGDSQTGVEGVAAFKLNLGGKVVVYPGTYDALFQPMRALLAQWLNNRGHWLVRFLVGRRA
jgi:peptidoglycan pentaglycine glycine transferase (the first glycine)